MKKFTQLTFMAICLFSSSLYAEAVYSEEIYSGAAYSKAVQAEERYASYLSLLGFTLEKTQLHHIQQTLGNAPIHQHGNGLNASPRICYYDKTNNATLSFESGPQGGKNLRLLSFSVVSGNENHNSCGLLRLTENDLTLGGLSLGVIFDSAKKTLPQPWEYIKGYGYLHKHFNRRPFSQREIRRFNVKDLNTAFWSISIYIEVFKDDDVITGFKISKLTSW